MAGRIIEHTDYTGAKTISADVCIIGSGCGGATLAKRLADLGLNVVVVEQGGYYPAHKMDQNELNMAGKISAERNFDTSADGGTTLSYGANVGGASVHYWADSYRTPADRLDLWRDGYGVEGHGLSELEPAWDEIERNLNIHEAEDEYFNRMNQLLRDGSQRLGWKGHRVPQARKFCQKSGHCMQGCLYDAKQSQAVVHLPMAMEKGADVYADCMARNFVHAGGKVVALEALAMNRATNRPTNTVLRFEAKAFAVAAGGFNSPAFLLQQDFASSLPALGKHFSMNPSAMVHALFEERIELWRNIPAAWGVEEFRLARYDRAGVYREGGYLLVANQIQPGLLGAILPGFGADHAEWMASLPSFGGTIGWIDDHPDELGEIIVKDGRRKVNYTYGPITQKILRDLLKKQVMVLREAGARRIMIGDYSGTEIRSDADMKLIDDMPISAGGLLLAAPHPGGGCRMGKDAATSVVGSDHRVHGFSNLFVADSSVFPTPVSLDPSLTIMGFSYVAAQHIHDALH